MRTSLQLFLCAFLFAGPVGAANLLQNGNFDHDLSGWTNDVPASWSSTDSDGLASSGSAHVVNSDPGGHEGGLGQCVRVDGGAAYELGVRILAPSTNIITSGAAIGARPYFYSSTNCDPPTVVAVGTGAAVTPKDEWIQLANFETAPANARSARVLLIADTASGGPALAANFDHVFFGPSTPGALVTQYLPTVGSLHGLNESFYHSDVWITNLSHDSTGTFTLSYHCYPGYTCNSAPNDFTLAPRQTRAFRDIVGGFMGSPETQGGLEITYDEYLAPAAVMQHLYTPWTQPTFGFSALGRFIGDTRTRVDFPGVAGGGPGNSGFRSNLGFYNPNDVAANVTITLYTAAGTQIGSPIGVYLEPHNGAQVNNVFARSGSTSPTLIGDLSAVVTSDVAVFSFASRLDNVSNDPAFTDGGVRDFAGRN